MKDRNCFLTKVKELKLYIIEFNKDGAIKIQDYLVDYIVGKEKYYPIIVIIYDKYIFFANNEIWKVWIWQNHTFLQPKKQG